MDDGTIVSRYKRYKAGTKQVTSYLANTAAQRCDLRDVLDCLNDTPASGVHTTIQVKTRELLALAKVVVTAKFTVPAGILEVLQDVTSGRQSCASWYASQTTEEDSDLVHRNGTHLHFIGILQEVQEHLSGLKMTPGSENMSAKTAKDSEKKNKKKKKKKTAGGSDDLHNLFQYLDVEEPSDSALGQSGPAKPTAKPDYELENDQEMDFFALWCHLKDMSDTRLFLMDAWLEYQRGDLTIEVAGTVTDFAIAMLNRAHADFVGQFPQFDQWSAIMDFLQLRTCFTSNVICVFPRKGTGASKERVLPGQAETKVTDLLCPAAAFLLRKFSDSTINIKRSGTALRNYDEMINVPSYSEAAHPVTAFGPHLMSLVPSIIYAQVLQDQTESKFRLPKSSLIAALWPLVGVPQDHGPPISAVFACQICMDISDIVKSDPDCGSTAVLQVAAMVKDSTDRTQTFFSGQHSDEISHKDCIMADSRDRADHYRKRITSVRELRDPDVLRTLSKEEICYRLASKFEFPFLHVCPHIGGQAVQQLKVAAHTAGTIISNQGNVIVMLAHFYKAAVRYGLVTAAWHDMDFLISQHSGKKPFITKTHSGATDPYAMLKHCYLDVGGDATTFTYGKPPPQPTWQMLLKAKTFSRSASALFSGMDDRVAEQLKLGIEPSEDCYEIWDGVLSTAMANSERGPKASKKRQYSSTQRVASLKAMMIEDEPRMNFPYLDFTMMCMEMHRKIMSAGVSDEHWPNIFKDYETYEWGYEYVYTMLEVAGDAVAQGRSVMKSGFGVAALAMQYELSLMDTKKYSQAAFDASSGRIPKAKRPQHSNDPPCVGRDELSKNHPDISFGSSRDTLDFYDPEGSPVKFSDMFQDSYLRGLLPDSTEQVIECD